MRFPVLAFLLAAAGLTCTTANASPLGDKLGFEPDAKIVIIHADDLGSIESANRAGADVLAYGVVSSASIMMTCPAVEGALEYARANPKADLGIHVTLTSEWQNYRWGPTEPQGEVRSLVDRTHNLQPSLYSLFFRGNTQDVAAEIESQIKANLAAGVHPTHMDTHMGSAYLHPEWLYTYMNLGLKYHIPPVAPKWSDDLRKHYGFIAGNVMSFVVPGFMKKVEDAGFLLLDYLVDQPFPKHNTYESRKQAYLDILKSVKPGVTQILLHPAYADADFRKKIMSSNPDTVLRDWEAKMFQDPEFKKVLAENHIHLIGWREIQKAYDWDKVQEIKF